MKTVLFLKMKRFTNGLLFASLVGLSSQALAQIYVKPVSGNDGNSGLKPELAVKTLTAALTKINNTPNRIIQVIETGTFSEYVYIAKSNLTIDGGGSAISYSGISPDFKSPVYIKGSNIKVQNFKITGGVHNPNSAVQITRFSKNITIHGNTVFNTGGGGIHANGADYITVTNNTVYGNAHRTSSHCGSGISLWELWNSDTNTTSFKNKVANNIVYANLNKTQADSVGCAKKGADLGVNYLHADGSGIIIDDSQNTQQAWNGRDSSGKAIPYKGRTMIENNLVMGNGGRGVHLFRSENVTVRHNTLYYNNADPHEASWRPGEIMAVSGGNHRFHNNIAVTKANVTLGTGVRTAITVTELNSGPVTATNNLVWNAINDSTQVLYARSNAFTVTMSLANNRFGDPKFRAPSLSPSTADFRLTLGSPALNYGLEAFRTDLDILGNRRATIPDVGAYEY